MLLSVIFTAYQENRLQFLTVQPSPLPTPVKLKPLAEFLTGYHNDIVEFLISGFSQGERNSLAATNLISTLQNPKAVDMKRVHHFNLFAFLHSDSSLNKHLVISG